MLLGDTERLFDALLTDATTGKRTPEECLALCETQNPELASSLKFALLVRTVALDDSERDLARANVRQRLTAVLESADNTRPESHSDVLSPARRTRRRIVWMRQLAVVAAALAFVFLGTWLLTDAAASALPDSPLYAIKRADENVELTFSWSNQMRGEVLAQIAVHRLSEARSEAASQHTTRAVALMGESNAATQQLINLAIATKTRSTRDGAVTDSLAKTLEAEYAALAQAQSDGQTWLAQLLQHNVSDQQTALSAGNIWVPLKGAPTPTAPAAPIAPIHVMPTTPAAGTPHPTSHPTPPTKPTPDANGSDSSGQGNGGTGSGNPNSGDSPNSSDGP
jgi:uncharacterized protein DUF5667